MHDMDDLRKIDLNLLLTLHALLSEKHVTRASLRLHRSQPAVSHSLRCCGNTFMIALLIRKNGKMTLSARAHTLLPLGVSLLGLNNLLAPESLTPRRQNSASGLRCRITPPG
jgi:DNA-binding transcriptional LysR family regulator